MNRGREPRPPWRHFFHANGSQSTGSIPKRRDSEKPSKKTEGPKEYIEKPVAIHENTGKTFDEEEKEESKIDFDSLRNKFESLQKKNIKLSENPVKKFESPKQYNDKGDQDKGKSREGVKWNLQNEHTRQSNKTSPRHESMEQTQDSQRHDDKLLKILENLQEKIDKGDQDKDKILKILENLQGKFDKGDQDKAKSNEDKILKILENLQRKFDKGDQDKAKSNEDKILKILEKLQEKFDKGDQDKAKSHEAKLVKILDKDGQEKVGSKSFYAAWKKEGSRAVNVTLNAATAHPALLLYEDGKRVTWQEPCQNLPRSSQRFDSLPCVLGQQGISSGKCHWEVEVGDTQSWDLGICRDDVKRKGRVTMSPGNGFWAIRLYDGEYWALTSPETHLTLTERPLHVGIFLDYEAGEVSFCNMTDGSYIFSFPKNTFNGVLRPLFRLWSSDSGRLSIVHVEEN